MNSLLLSLIIVSQCGPNGCNTGRGLLFGPRVTYTHFIDSTSYVIPTTSYVIPTTSYVVPTTSYVVPPYVVPPLTRIIYNQGERDSYNINTKKTIEIKMGYFKTKYQGVVLTVYGFRNENNKIEWDPDHPVNQAEISTKTILVK
jgi:hypothetical protein